MAQTSITSFFKKSPSAAETPKQPKALSTGEPDGSTSLGDVVDAEYDPSSDSYHPINDACWKAGQKTPYLALAKTFEAIEAESKRLAIIRTMGNFFRSVILLSPEDLVRCLYLSLNKIAPAWDGLELGVGESIVVKAVAEATGRTVKKLKELLSEAGDLGVVAAASRNTQRTLVVPTILTVEKVFLKFQEISRVTGNSSQTKKINIIKSLLVAAKSVEAKYIVRALTGKMRMGLAEQSALVALANAVVLSPPNQDVVGDHPITKLSNTEDKFKKAVNVMKRAYNEYPHYEFIISALVKGGLEEVEKTCRIRPGIPIKPMLAHPSKGIDLLLGRLGDLEFVSEYKYDGERAQIHRQEDGKVTIFSRNQEEHTGKFPEVVSRIPAHPKEGVTSFILDAEVVAWDVEEKKILPFQILSTRKRKNVESAKDVKVQVCVYAFDLLYLNGESLISTSLRQRQKLLRESFTTTEGEFVFATNLVSNEPEAVQLFMTEAIQNSCEGLMVKALDKPYEISKRSNNWLKLKKDYLDNIGDSVDVVVVGAFFGTGKRAGGYGSYLVAVYNPDREEYETLCKLATGFSDEQLEKFTAYFKHQIIQKPLPTYKYNQKPEVWFSPVQVWEIKGADLSVSPVHTAGVGMVDPAKGISLRFPRFIRVREDKNPEDATSGGEIVRMYQEQFARQVEDNNKVVSDEDDDY